MFKTQKKSEDPSPAHSARDEENAQNMLSRLKSALRRRPETSLRAALEEYIEEVADDTSGLSDSVVQHEHNLITNILKLRDLTTVDVMIPRADIVAVDVNTTQKDLLKLLSERQFNRLPVYQDTLDNILGTIHSKDILTCLALDKPVEVRSLIREIPIVSPAMHVLDLLLQMRQTRRHMVLVVDEFGGIDGLVTIGDVVESIVGEIDDERNLHDAPFMGRDKEGRVIADGRVDIDTFEESFGRVLSDEDREESDTLGGLVFSLAGRVPARGEVLTHANGMTFEVLDADPRRVNRLRINNIPVSES